jgi:hypothetical protein
MATTRSPSHGGHGTVPAETGEDWDGAGAGGASSSKPRALGNIDKEGQKQRLLVGSVILVVAIAVAAALVLFVHNRWCVTGRARGPAFQPLMAPEALPLALVPHRPGLP